MCSAISEDPPTFLDLFPEIRSFFTGLQISNITPTVVQLANNFKFPCSSDDKLSVMNVCTSIPFFRRIFNFTERNSKHEIKYFNDQLSLEVFGVRGISIINAFDFGISFQFAQFTPHNKNLK
uniref:Uncharacterized protein n=1 Tax=Megaselia scalaris TaxID=36166 RepID=T1GE56_MEGSC